MSRVESLQSSVGWDPWDVLVDTEQVALKFGILWCEDPIYYVCCTLAIVFNIMWLRGGLWRNSPLLDIEVVARVAAVR